MLQAFISKPVGNKLFISLLAFISFSFGITAGAQTKKVAFREYVFYPYTSQKSMDNPSLLPYQSASSSITVLVEDNDLYESVKEFLDDDEDQVRLSWGSESINGLSLGWVVETDPDDADARILTGMVKFRNSGNGLLVTMKYAADNSAAGKNALAMFRTFRRNTGAPSQPVKPTTPTTTTKPNTNTTTGNNSSGTNNTVTNNSGTNNSGNTNSTNNNTGNNSTGNSGSGNSNNNNNPGTQTGSVKVNIPQILSSHNAYRSELGLPNLVWSSTLADYAQAWVDELTKNRDCDMVHRPYNKKDPWNLIYGENIFWGSSGYTFAEAVKAWGSEKSKFNHNTKTCMSAGYACGHYTQIIWRNTTEVGCAMAKCKDGSVLMVCNYNPAGNIADEKPY